MLKKSLIAVTIAGLLGGCNSDDNPLPPEALGIINEMPNIIPTIKSWEGEVGFAHLTKDSQIIINAIDADQLEHLNRAASILRQDILAINDQELEIIEGGSPGVGDIVINVMAGDAPVSSDYPDESYRIEIEDAISIVAPEVRGAAYALATLKQLLVLDKDGNDSLPKGIIEDEPSTRVRGLMLDIGRRAVSLEFIKNYMKFMSYYKMSELQLHLNDNKIIWGEGGDNDGSNWHEDTWKTDAFSAFRAQIDAYPELAAEDISYSKEELQELKDLADALGLSLTAEIEAPAHAMAFTKLDPTIRHPDMRPDHLDLSNPRTFEILETVWNEIYPYFHRVHIGADEYAGDRLSEELTADMTNYMNRMNTFLKERGHNGIRVWGNTSTLTHQGEGLDKDIVQQIWASGFSDPENTYNLGFNMINLNDAYYTVPTGNAGYQDTIVPSEMYKNWKVNQFSGGWSVDVDDPQFLGGFIANWNDLGWSDNWAYTDADLHARLRNVVKIAAQKMWNIDTVLPFAQFQSLAYTLGDSPNFEIGYPAKEEDIAAGKTVLASSYKNIIYRLGGSPNGEKLLDVNFLGHPGGTVDVPYPVIVNCGVAGYIAVPATIGFMDHGRL